MLHPLSVLTLLLFKRLFFCSMSCPIASTPRVAEFLPSSALPSLHGVYQQLYPVPLVSDYLLGKVLLAFSVFVFFLFPPTPRSVRLPSPDSLVPFHSVRMISFSRLTEMPFFLNQHRLPPGTAFPFGLVAF